MGKGKDPNANDQSEHVARPLASLKDPSSFGPPPKRNGTSVVTSPGGTTTPTSTIKPSLRGLGAAVPVQQSSRQAEEEDKPAAPPLPYRANTTGLETNHLPPPPVRNDVSSIAQPVASPSTRPSLPPRLPARAPVPQSASPPPPPPYSETDNAVQMNQGAVSRLGQAGVSVPGLGIGAGSDQSATAQTNLNKQVNELQSRFGSMSASSPGDSQNHVAGSPNGTSPYDQPNSYGRTNSYGQNQEASAGSAANIRQRGGDQFEAGKKKLSAFNQKHKITDRVHSYFERPPAPGQESASAPPPPPPHPNHPNNLSRQNSNIDVEALNKRKPPPPPPPAKKPGLQSKPVVSSAATTPSPPPLPLGTKPR